MQTFLAYPDIPKSLKCLDYKREGNQRIEAKGILYICHRHFMVDLRKEFNISDKYAEYLWKRYRNHPAIKMWLHHKNALTYYYNCSILEWKGRGYTNTMKLLRHGEIIYPYWFGNEEFHASHRSNLLRKNLDFYQQFGWKEPNNLPYVWPV